MDATGADKKGRGQAALQLIAGLTLSPRGTNVDIALDLQLSGAAAQYGRGMISDVTSVLLNDFATNMQNRLQAAESGLDPNQVASLKPARWAVDRAAGYANGAGPRLPSILPSLPTPDPLTRRTFMWTIGNVILLVVVVPVLIAVLNRVPRRPGADTRGR